MGGSFAAASQGEPPSWEETVNSSGRLGRVESRLGAPQGYPDRPPALAALLLSAPTRPLPSLLPPPLLPLLPPSPSPSLLFLELILHLSSSLFISSMLTLKTVNSQHEDAKCHLHWRISAWSLQQTQARRGWEGLEGLCQTTCIWKSLEYPAFSEGQCLSGGDALSVNILISI